MKGRGEQKFVDDIETPRIFNTNSGSEIETKDSTNPMSFKLGEFSEENKNKQNQEIPRITFIFLF